MGEGEDWLSNAVYFVFAFGLLLLMLLFGFRDFDLCLPDAATFPVALPLPVFAGSSHSSWSQSAYPRPCVAPPKKKAMRTQYLQGRC